MSIYVRDEGAMLSVEKWLFEPQLEVTMFEFMYQLTKAFIDSMRVNVQTFVSKQSKPFVVRTESEEHSFLSATSSCGG